MPEPTNRPDPGFPTDTAAFRALVERARGGDESTLPTLRRIVQTPEGVALLGGDLAEQAERSLIRAMAGENLAFREALARKLELLRLELAGPDPTPVERLLVERAVACWLQVQEADIRYAQSEAKHNSTRWADCYQRRMDAAHRRYLSTLKALALVRKLAVPVLQVNIARKQVNVAGAAPVPTATRPAG